MIIIKQYNDDSILSPEEVTQFAKAFKTAFAELFRQEGSYLGGDGKGFGVGLKLTPDKVDIVLETIVNELQGIDKDRLVTFLLIINIVNSPKSLLVESFKEAFGNE